MSAHRTKNHCGKNRRYSTQICGKYLAICSCSRDTALRDINDLIAKEMLRNSGEGGRSANYLLSE